MGVLPASTERPDMTHRIDIHGDLARQLADTAKVNGIEVAHLIENTLRRAAGLVPFDTNVEVQPRLTVNDGNHGFHVLTVVTDGGGNFVAEDTEGRALARLEMDVDSEMCVTEEEDRQLRRGWVLQTVGLGLTRIEQLAEERRALIDAAEGS